MNNIIAKSDFIISFGTMVQNKQLKTSINEATSNNAQFIYMHPIDNYDLKGVYSQFLKYEVGSEEGICALLLNTFVKNCDEKIDEYLEDLDLGYISAESSAGEEEFEEIFEKSLEKKSKLLIIGEDFVNHHRIENIVKFLAVIKKFTDFEFLILDEELSKKIENCVDFDLEDVEELKSFNGTLVYKLLDEKSDENLLVSQTFANVAKVTNGAKISINANGESLVKTLKIDENLNGTIAILKTTNCENVLSGYKYKQVKIEKVEA